jgi:acetyl esterase/lipase
MVRTTAARVCSALVAVLLPMACGTESPDADARGADAGVDDAEPGTPDGRLPVLRALRLADVVTPVTEQELAAAQAHWTARDLAAHDVREVARGSVTLGTVAMTYRVLSHRVEGRLHYGAVLVPADVAPGASLPMLVYAHGGYTGVGGLPPYRVETLQLVVPGQPLRSRMIYVVPAYRGERLEIDGKTFAAEGKALLANTDVADTATLITATLQQTPQADGERIAILGESRGGLVALALAAYDRRIDLVIDAYGPTDFRVALAAVDEPTFLGSVRMALEAPDDPQHLIARSLVPIERVSLASDGSLQLDDEGFREMRRRMTVTSATSQARLLPSLQVHHGTADPTASVAYARALRDAMQAIGRATPSDSFTYYEYPGGAHSLASLPGSVDRIAEALTRVLRP